MLFFIALGQTLLTYTNKTSIAMSFNNKGNKQGTINAMQCSRSSLFLQEKSLKYVCITYLLAWISVSKVAIWSQNIAAKIVMKNSKCNI